MFKLLALVVIAAVLFGNIEARSYRHERYRQAAVPFYNYNYYTFNAWNWLSRYWWYYQMPLKCPEHPKCPATQKGMCPNVTDPANGMAHIHGTSIGDIISFSCAENFTLCGAEKIVCTSKLQWSDPVPVCFYPKFTVELVYANYSYLFSKEGEVRSKASLRCSNTNRSLVTIKNKQEQDFLKCVVWEIDQKYKQPNYPWLTGLQFKHGTWQWDSGENLTKSFFSDNEPTTITENDCAALAKGNLYEWSSTHCIDAENSYICEKHIDQ